MVKNIIVEHFEKRLAEASDKSREILLIEKKHAIKAFNSYFKKPNSRYYYYNQFSKAKADNKCFKYDMITFELLYMIYADNSFGKFKIQLKNIRDDYNTDNKYYSHKTLQSSLSRMAGAFINWTTKQVYRSDLDTYVPAKMIFPTLAGYMVLEMIRMKKDKEAGLDE